MMETIKKMRNAECGMRNVNPKTVNRQMKSGKRIPRSALRAPRSESGMSLLVVLAVMTLFAIALLAVAPTVQQGVQRERELEAIRRGEEVADAIRQYMIFYQGKLPSSMDDLLEGLPQGTKKRQILRPSAAIDPLSADGKWRLIAPTTQAFLNFGRRVQIYNNGLLPSSPQPTQIFDRYASQLVNITNTKSDDDLKEDSDEEIEVPTDKTPFIGVASQSRSSSIIAYYGIENHSKWIFTPLFRGVGVTYIGGSRNTNPPLPNGTPTPPNAQP
ncbi:MAG: type IV pilus modification PilV family protein [Pyrinomonadaceae bacterium]